MNLGGTRTRRPAVGGQVQIKLERMEDRLVPGESLSAILLAPTTMAAVPAWGQFATADDPSSIAVADLTPAADGNSDATATGDSFTVYVGASVLPDRENSTRADDAPVSANGTTFTEDAPVGGIFTSVATGPTAPQLPPIELSGLGTNGGVAAPAAPAAAMMPASGVPAINAGMTAPSAGSDSVARPMFVAQASAHPDRGGSPPFTGFTPAQIRQAYGFGFDQLPTVNGLPNDGAGQTIAIVDAYHAPNIFNDLNNFDGRYSIINGGSQTLRQQYGEASTFLTQVDQTGGTNYPSANTGWAEEISLDVQWAHAIAPAAKILLVETNSAYISDLMIGVDYAATGDYAMKYGIPKASAVSMSWGGGDFSGESTYDSHFNVPGVTFVASAGDSGGWVEWPAASPYVVGVGGTSLTLSGGNYQSETAWSSSGGGISNNEAEPGYQTSFGITNTRNHRGTPDVAYDADPNTGVPVIYNGGVIVAGGTSAGAPQWAGLVALADQGRTLQSKSALSSNSLTTSPVYTAATNTVANPTLYSTNYHDITTGHAGFYQAGARYDLITGLGSPIANALVPYLINNLP
jgi:hypothetical protein